MPSSLRRTAAVLDFPGVVGGGPGDTAGGIALRPAPFDEGLPVRGLAEHIGERGSKFGDSPTVVSSRWLEANPQLRGVRTLRTEHVVRDLVTITTTAAGTLAELRWCAREHLIEDDPGRVEQGRDSLGLGRAERAGVALCFRVRRSEICGGRAGKMLHHAKRRGRFWIERDARLFGNRCVARRIGRERGNR